MKLQRQFCDGNADANANADGRDDYKYLFLYLFFHKELMGHIMRNPVFVIYVNNKGASLLFAAWIGARFYSSKLYSWIGTYTVSRTCQFAESV